MTITLPIADQAIRQGTPEWLEARRHTIGSSDIPVIIGESPHKSAYTLAAEKLGLIPEIIDPETQELMDIGKLMQPVLLAIYARKTGRHARAVHGWRVNRETGWATASLDGTAPVRRIVEAKWSHSKRWRSSERIPGDVEAQVQWQLFVTGWDVADVVVMDFGRSRIEVVERDDRMIGDLLYFARDFRGYLQRGELPPIDGSESSRQALAARHPRDDGTILEPDADLAELGTKLAEARAAKKAADDSERTIANAIRMILGDASGVRGLLSLRKNADSTRVNWPAVASAYLNLLTDVTYHGCEHLPLAMKERAIENLDAVQSAYSETVEGARVLRLLKGGTE